MGIKMSCKLLINDELMHVVEEKIKENRQFIIKSFSLYFLEISQAATFYDEGIQRRDIPL